MADLTFIQYVKAQTRKAEKVEETMLLQGLPKTPVTDRMIDKNMAYIIRTNRVLDNNHKHWDRWDREFNAKRG